MLLVSKMQTLSLWMLKIAPIFLTLSILSGQAHGVGNGSAQVTLNLFSGRPDPVFSLQDPSQIAQVVSLVQASSAKPYMGDIMPSRLGYRGISIENSGNIAGLPPHMAVFNGSIELINGQTRTVLEDKDKVLENFLIDLALSQGLINDKVVSFINQGRQ